MTEESDNAGTSAPIGVEGDDRSGETLVGERFFGRKMDGTNFSEADLTRASFKRTSLQGALLTDASLCGAQLTHVNLAGASLDGANLQGALLSNVDLSDADLTGANLVGATLKGVNLDRANLTDAQMSGTLVETASCSETDLSSTRLDGMSAENASFSQARFTGAGLQGAQLSRCSLDECSLEGCDLSGATVETGLLKNSILRDCLLHGTLFQKVRFRDIEVESCDARGCSFDDCSGLTADVEMELSETGAILSPSIGSRGWRIIRGNRRVQLSLLIAFAVVLAIVVVVLSVPSLWPSWALVARMESLTNDPERSRWCGDYIDLGEELADRTMDDVGRQNALLSALANCYSAEEKEEDAERVLNRRIEIASTGQPTDSLSARLDLAKFFAAASRNTEAEEIVEGVIEDPRAPILVRLDGLRILEQIFQQRGVDVSKPEDWIGLQVQIAEEILAIDEEIHTAGLLMDTPAQLYTWGKWEIADRLLERATPPISNQEAWTHASRALQSSSELGRQEETIAFTEYLLGTQRYSQGLYRALAVHAAAELLLTMDKPEAIEGLFEELEGEPDDELLLVRSIVDIRRHLAEEDVEAALKIAEAVAPGEKAVPFPLLEKLVWARVDANLAAERETVAVEALTPLLEALDGQDSFSSLNAKLVEMSAGLENPQLLAELLKSVENPWLSEANALQDVMFSSLVREAEAGTLALDDPRLLEMMDSTETWVAESAVQLMLQSATGSGQDAEAIAFLRARAKNKTGDHKIFLGLALVDAELNQGNPHDALQSAEELGLDKAITGEARHRFLDLMIRASLAEGNESAASERLQQARDLVPPVSADFLAGMVLQITQHQAENGKIAEALQLVQETRAELNPPMESDLLFREQLYLLYLLNRDEEADVLLAQYAQEVSACDVQYEKVSSLTRAGRQQSDAAPLVKACSAADAEDDVKLQIAMYLADDGHCEDSLAIVTQIVERNLPLNNQIDVAVLEARCLFQTGEQSDAMELLDDAYTKNVDADQRSRVTSMMIGFLEEQEDAPGIVDTYTRLTEDHPTAAGREIWEQASLGLIHLGEIDRIEALEGQPAWEEALHFTKSQAQFHELIEAGKFGEAWTFVGDQLAFARTLDDRDALLGWARETQQATSDDEKYLAFLGKLLDDVPAGSPIARSILLDQAEALRAGGNPKDAVALLRPVLDPEVAGDDHRSILQAYARSIGLYATPSEIEKELKALEAKGLTPELSQQTRLMAADSLLERNEYEAARTLLEPLAGVPLAGSLAAESYHVIIRAWVDDGLFKEAVDLPSRFPPGSSMTTCQVDLSLSQALPWESDESQKLRARILGSCALATLSPDEILAFVNGIANSDPDEATSLLKRYRSEVQLSQTEEFRMDIGQARLLASQGKWQPARKLLRAVIAESTEPWTITEATSVLLSGSPTAENGMDSKVVLEDVHKAIERVGAGTAESIQIHRDVAQYHLVAGRGTEAIKWQREAVAMMPEASMEKGYELLQLARLELSVDGSRSSAWKSHSDEAMKIATPGSPLWLELLVFQTAAQIAAASPGRAESILVNAQNGVPDGNRPEFAAAVSDGLDYSLNEPEKAQTVRDIATERWP